MSLHQDLNSELHHAVVAVRILGIIEGIVLINNHVNNYYILNFIILIIKKLQISWEVVAKTRRSVVNVARPWITLTTYLHLKYYGCPYQKDHQSSYCLNMLIKVLICSAERK